MPTVRFCFDVISPFAWLAWKRIGALCEEEGAALVPQPVLFGALLHHHGQLGPAEIPAKRDYTFAQVFRTARRRGLDMRGPARHPFNPVTALRLCLPAVAGEHQHAVIDAIFDAGWQRGDDLSDPTALGRVLDGLGLDGDAMLRETRDPAVKATLRANTDAAIAAGAFGVPTMIIDDGTLFWGDDSLDDLRLALRGQDPLDVTRLRDALRRPGDHRPR